MQRAKASLASQPAALNAPVLTSQAALERLYGSSDNLLLQLQGPGGRGAHKCALTGNTFAIDSACALYY